MKVNGFVTLLFLCLFLLDPVSAVHASSDDSFIQGYGTAVLVREFGASPSALHVKDGIITLNAGAVAPARLADAVSALMGIEGVVRVEIAGAESLETGGTGDTGSRVDASVTGDQEESVSPDNDGRHHPERLFEPLMADPRWPRFSVSYQLFTDNGDLNNLIASGIGDTIPVYGGDHPFTGTWQAAVQAAAYAINDLDTSSWDLLNSDYRFGLAFLNRKGPVSGIYRLYHFSTHVGDEAILNSGARRESISYEAIDAIFSQSPRKWLRIFGGAAYRFSRHPKDMDPWSFQYGLELKSSRRYLKVLRPVAGANFYNTEDNDWHTEVSFRAGAEIEGPETRWHKVQFLMGFYNGPSPFGQFSHQSQEYLDFGIYLSY